MSDKTDVHTWHKSLCLVFRKLGIVEMLITDEDLIAIQNLPEEDMPAMVAASSDDGLHLILTTQKEAREFQDKVGTLESSGLIVPHPTH